MKRNAQARGGPVIRSDGAQRGFHWVDELLALTGKGHKKAG